MITSGEIICTRRRLPGTGLIRTLVLTSWVMPGIVIGVADGVEQTVRARGHALVMANAGEDSQQERALIADLLRRGIEGLVVVPSGPDHAHLAGVARRVPLVLAHRPVDATDVDVVLDVPLTLLTYDQGELGRLAAALLLDRIDGASRPARRVVVPVTARRLSAPPAGRPAR